MEFPKKKLDELVLGDLDIAWLKSLVEDGFAKSKLVFSAKQSVIV